MCMVLGEQAFMWITCTDVWLLSFSSQMMTRPAKVKARACWRTRGGACTLNSSRYEGMIDD